MERNQPASLKSAARLVSLAMGGRTVLRMAIMSALSTLYSRILPLSPKSGV